MNSHFYNVMHVVRKLNKLSIKNIIPLKYPDPKRMSTKSKLLKEDCLLAKCKQLPPPLSQDKHKGEAGRIGVFGGSLEYTGAPYYAAITSLKVGADLVYVFCMKDAATVIKTYSPELIVLPFLDHKEAAAKIEPWLDRLHVVLIGPGLGRDEPTFNVIKQVINSCKKLKKPMVIDADGLFLLSKDINLIKDYPNKLILTPNIVEFSRLVGSADKQKYRSNSAKLFDLCSNLTVLVKGQEDLIFDKMVEARVTGSGSGRRSGGQGDLLAGAISTFLAWSMQKEVSAECEDTYDDRALVATFAACKLVRECNRLAFSKLGRSMTALDMTHEIHTVFDYYFENKKNAIGSVFD
ncbi:ATP-dependent (S)-NAD(P)H-hydrate dehydratase [Coccinella septempunctata]|uniref:ATP-dependent (S)-NAD(P)H-hydrate dehydratase n=1 Tax=Coccinella septempunctata TaxID=41139 RepID=UPI001D0705FA|nr:ATP-dependent (S)-NAD(P)H-hydrate dehydratase [Coccinella septempunctata]